MEEQQAIPAQEAPPSAGEPVSPPCTDQAPRQRQRASLPPPSNVAARHAKRLTLNFPIGVQPGPQHQSQTEQSSPSPGTMRPLNPSIPSPSRSSTASPSTVNDPPSDTFPILTAIATQERKVLELREELQKAELELTTLKKQWVLGERGRKRTEIFHRAEPLKHLNSAQTSPQGEESTAESESDKQRPEDQSALAAQTRLSHDLRRQGSISRSSIDSPTGSDPGGMSKSSRGRTVFQNSRHARNLSLLSATGTSNQKPSFPQPRDVDDPQYPESARTSRFPRSATLPSMDRDDPHKRSEPVKTLSSNPSQAEKSDWRRSLPPIPQDPSAEAFVRTGRQMATDFRDGLWTFLDDIRQATVGEEAVNGTESRSIQGSQVVQRGPRRHGVPSNASRERSAASSRTGNSARSNRLTSTSSGKAPAAGNMDISFWSEFGIDAPEQTPTTARAKDSDQDVQKNQEESNQADFDDNWDDWDTPQPKAHTPSSSSSTFPKRDRSPSTNTSSPRTSTSLTDVVPSQGDASSGHKRSDSIPWPALTKLHPSKLTRTASNLMAEWEKSLTPPNERATAEDATEANKEGKSD